MSTDLRRIEDDLRTEEDELTKEETFLKGLKEVGTAVNARNSSSPHPAASCPLPSPLPCALCLSSTFFGLLSLA
jgi:hypothetical protein